MLALTHPTILVTTAVTSEGEGNKKAKLTITISNGLSPATVHEFKLKKWKAELLATLIWQIYQAGMNAGKQVCDTNFDPEVSTLITTEPVKFSTTIDSLDKK